MENKWEPGYPEEISSKNGTVLSDEAVQGMALGLDCCEGAGIKFSTEKTT